MKNILLTASCILLFLAAGAQYMQKNAGYKKVTNIIRLANGKYAYLSFICRDTAANVFLHSSCKPAEPYYTYGEKTGILNSLPIYHVVFHFDQTPWEVMCNGTDTVFDVFNMTWINYYTVEAWMPEGYYDIVSCFFFGPAVPAYVFVKDFHVNMNRDTTILSTSADHQLALHAVDENNVLLPNNEKAGDALGILIEYPENFKCPMEGYSFAGWPSLYQVNFSDVRPDIKIYSGITAMIKYPQYHRYEISYPALMGFTQDTTLANNPADYRHYALIYHGSPAVSEPYFVFGYGNMNNCLLGSLDYMLFSIGVDDTPSKPTDTVRLFSSNAAVDTNKYLFCYSLGHCEYNPSTMSGFEKLINNWLYYLTPDNNLVLSASGKYPPVTGDYLAGNGMTANIGNSAPFNSGFSNNSSNGFQIRVTPRFTGQANEGRGIDEGMGTYDIWEEFNHVYHDSIRNSTIIWGGSGPWNYSVVLNDSNYSVCGMPGYLQSKMNFNLGNDDANPPRLRSMQILMGDSVATTVIHGFSSSVMFTAGDWIAVPGIYFKVFHQLKEAHLYYKNFTESQWHELTIQSQPANLDSILGMPYVGDLEQVLSQYPDSAYIDLKIELTDSAGNSNIQTIHPAFLVRDAMTGIKPVYDNQSLLIYPDPALDKIHIASGEEPIFITIYSLTGQQVMEVNNTKEIDVSGLSPGLYIVRITELKTGRISFGKFIR